MSLTSNIFVTDSPPTQTYGNNPLHFEDDICDAMNVSPAENYENIFARNFGAFSPLLEDPSPDANHYDSGSSPIGPVTPTPFGEFVDRAITSDYVEPTIDPTYPDLGRQSYGAYHGNQQPQYGHQVSQLVHNQSPRKQIPTVTAPPPTATIEYKKLVDPLSEWLACYVWRVCCTGAGLPSHFVRPS